MKIRDLDKGGYFIPNKFSLPVILIRIVIVYALLAILLFVPANTLDWPEAWLFLLLCSIFSVFTVTWFMKKNPTVLQSRASTKPRSSFDRNIMIAFLFFFIIYLFSLSYDAKQIHWSTIPVEIKVFGFVMIISALLLFFLILNANPFASRTIEVQKKQKTITTGPYRFVRHPMYSGAGLFVIGIPLALGSYIALVPGIVIILIFVIRIPKEEKTLEDELAGYKEYKAKVRYRLIPKIF